MTNTRFTLLRHGNIVGVPALYGHTDALPSAQGNAVFYNALNAIHAQQPIEQIITSPLLRCVGPASMFATEKKIPILLEPALKEMNFGDWDGVDFNALTTQWSDLEAFWQSPDTHQPPNGEALDAFAKRVIDTWENMLRQRTHHHYLLACHGGVIRIIIAHVLQMDWRNANLFKQLHIGYASHTRIDIGTHAEALPVIKWIGAIS